VQGAVSGQLLRHFWLNGASVKRFAMAFSLVRIHSHPKLNYLQENQTDDSNLPKVGVASYNCPLTLRGMG